MAESRTEEVISTSNPTVEVIEEKQPDGTVLRKKKTTRTITKRVLSTSTKESETGSSSTITSTSSTSSTSSGSSSSGVLISSESSLKEASGETTSRETTKETTTETTTETKEKEDATKSEASSKKTFKYKVFGEGDSQSHPFYRFLARFPLKSLPAQHQRPSPIKPILYAYAPGWKLNRPKEAKESKESTEATEASEEKKDDLPATGSFDVDSLKWMAYLKFNNIDYDIRPAFEPNMSPSGKLPFLALPNGSFVTEGGFEEFVQKNGSPDVKLDINEAAEAFAFTALAESKIHAALIYTLWFEEAHFKKTTRNHYFGHHVPVLKTILAYWEKSSIVHSMLLTRTQIDREQIFEEASTAIESIATLLGDSDYFFGKDAPSSLDAIVFAYLHVILTLPKIRADNSGRSSELARIVRKHSNLYEYSQKIWRKYFSA
ncbi:hypothetical protein BGZ74_000880 [Mortierella antarctica]|nr:hypothetical protein BGZ74_000880 [Mortierella antarctica]